MMDPLDGPRYLLAVTMLLVVVAGAAAGGQAIRHRLVPAWAGPPGWLADTVSGVAIVVIISEVLGLLGIFDAGPLVVLVALVGTGLRLGLSGSPTRAGTDADPTTVEQDHRLVRLAALVGVAIVLGQWAVRVRGELRTGITGFDNQWYHLPVAARLAHSGSATTSNFFSPDFPVSWHQSTSEVIHAIGMVLFDRDILSIWLFAMFAAILVLAAWCIGRPTGVGAASVLGAVVILGSTVVGIGNVAGAYSDLPATAFFLAAVALWMQPERRLGGIAIAGASAGLALSSKLTLAGLVAGLTIAVVVTASRGSRVRTALAWSGPLALTGSFWFVRNLIRAGNPIPGTSLGVGPLSFPAGSYPTPDRLGYSVADYLLHPSVWRSHFIPGLEIDLGPAWPLTIGLVMMAAGAALLAGRRSKDPTLVAVGAVIIVGLVAYVVAPTTALGERNEPVLFASNFRYAIPVLVLALAVLPVAARRVHARAPLVAAAAYGVAVVLEQLGGRGGPYPAWPPHDRRLGLAVVVVVASVGLATLVLRERHAGAGAGAPRPRAHGPGSGVGRRGSRPLGGQPGLPRCAVPHRSDRRLGAGSAQSPDRGG